MKDLLIKLYQGRLNEFENVKVQIEEAEGPLLMFPNEKYYNQKNKLMIVGQETKGWSDSSDISEQMKTYEDFNLGENYYSSPFWNVTRKVERALENEEYSCAWTNISKFDVAGEKPVGEDERIISQLDDLLVDEINIIKPDICIFFTYHMFDYRLERIYTDIEFVNVDGFTLKELCQLKHKDLPEKTYRTYHPKYLRLSKSKLEARFIEFIMSINKKI